MLFINSRRINEYRKFSHLNASLNESQFASLHLSHSWKSEIYVILLRETQIVICSLFIYVYNCDVHINNFVCVCIFFVFPSIILILSYIDELAFTLHVSYYDIHFAHVMLYSLRWYTYVSQLYYAHQWLISSLVCNDRLSISMRFRVNYVSFNALAIFGSLSCTF